MSPVKTTSHGEARILRALAGGGLVDERPSAKDARKKVLWLRDGEGLLVSMVRRDVLDDLCARGWVQREPDATYRATKAGRELGARLDRYGFVEEQP